MNDQVTLESPTAGIAERVRDFYNRYPYPPPVDSLDEYQRRWRGDERRRPEFHLLWPDREFREDQSILIAGCGTSQAAKHALRWPEAQVTGIDCSETSIQHTEKLKEKYGLKNLRVHQLAIERASELGKCFDQVICTGVLHHLADPSAGLAALRSVLKRDGIMQLMVYAPYGRAGIYLLQEFCQRVGIGPSDGEIRDLISALLRLPKGHPLQDLLNHAPELRNEAALADSLLHPNDRAYSVPQLFDFIEGAGMRFGRWLRQAPYNVQCGVLAEIPQADRIAKLPAKDQFAAIELFRGTMIRHSAVVYRDDYPGDPQPVSFNGNDWLEYIPIRMPDTTCVEDTRQAESREVLINRAHTYTDLILPISQAEKRILAAIDGKHRIGDLLRNLSPANDQSTNITQGRRFFEQLWRYDQVVFASVPQDPGAP